MVSARPSDVGGEGFDHPQPPPAYSGARTNQLRFPPAATLLITVAALFAAVLSVGLDLQRTIDEDSSRKALIAQIAVAQGPVATLSQAETNLDGVTQRGLAAFALALLISGLAWMRRPAAVRSEPPIDCHALMSSIPFGVACWTVEGDLISCNEQFRARLNLKTGEFPAGTRYLQSIRQLTIGGYTQLLRENDKNRLLELHRSDDSCLLIDERPLGNGTFITLISDVTASRRTDQLLATIREEQRLLARRYHEEKLKAEAANRAKTAFLAHLSHDIRTPLNHIIGFADLMRQQTYGALGDPRYVNYVDAMKGSGERLLSYFASILELAELEAGRRPQRLERMGADDLLQAAARRFSSQASRAGLTLRIGERCQASIVGDRFSLERMVANLVDNAVRFTPSGGKVTLAAYAASDGVVLEITDTGIGIPPERLETLSQPFAFRDDVLTRQQSGAGLGVAIARAIAETSGGRLAIDSRLGIGTTVAVSLPLQPAVDLPAAAAA